MAEMPAQHQPPVFWFYGLSGAGKTTITSALAAELRCRGIPCLSLDGDALRSGLTSDLGFTLDDRKENIRRAAETARLASHQGIIVLAAFITPTHELRALARRVIAPHPFYEIYLACDYATAEQRDAKGLYAQASSGALKHFTGRDSTFEPPSTPDLQINTQSLSIDHCVHEASAFIMQRLTLPSSFHVPTSRL